MYFPDLSNETYIGMCPYVKSIVWLSIDHPYQKGVVPENLVNVLDEHLKDAWVPFASSGKYECEFCSNHSDSRNLFIPDYDGKVYLAPGMIVHYIEAHEYQPPKEFVEAVLRAPKQKSAEFFNLIKKFGAWWDDNL